MAKYTIDDIEILRQKSGISYEEAINLLEYHNGSLARALVDLEKNGRLRDEGKPTNDRKRGKGILDFLYKLRFVVKKGNVTIINVSALFLLLVLATAPHICVIGLVVALLLGYRISIDRNSQDFADENVDDMLKKARRHVHQTVNSFTDQDSAVQSDQKENLRNEKAASGTKPVNVQFPDGGSVDVRDDGNGYHEADIQ